MNTDRAYTLFTMIHAIFGRTAPQKGSLVFDTLQDNTQDIPDECGQYIYSKAQDLDSLPQNLTKFFRKCWDMWRIDNPNRIARESFPECGGSNGTYFFRCLKKENGKREWIQCFAPCPVCTWIPPRMKDRIRPFCYTKRELAEKARLDASYVLIPDSYKGDVARFRLEMKIDNLPPNPYFPKMLEGFRQRYREGKAALDKERREEAMTTEARAVQ